MRSGKSSHLPCAILEQGLCEARPAVIGGSIISAPRAEACEAKLAVVEELAMHYFVRPGAEACGTKLTAVADLAIFRLAGPGAGACEAKLPAVADLAMHYFMRPGAEACEAQLYSGRGVFCEGLVRKLGVFRRSSLNVPQPPVLFIAGLHRR